MKALLRPAALSRLEIVEHRFCGDPDCDLVYYSASGKQRYSIADLKVAVGVKDPSAAAPVCYCFGHTRGSVWDEIGRTGASTVVRTISAHVKAGRCGCEVNNPAGRCCLGEVNRAVKKGFARLNRGETADGRRSGANVSPSPSLHSAAQSETLD